MTRHSPIKIWQSLIAAILLTFIVVLQSSRFSNGMLYLDTNLGFILINYLTWALLISFLYRWFGLDQSKWPGNKILITVLKFLAVILIQLILSNLVFSLLKYLVIQESFSSSWLTLKPIFMRAMASRALDLLVIIGLLRVLSVQRNITRQKLELAQLKHQLTESKLMALRMQLNPHFLFNALHAVHSLIGLDNDKSRQLLMKVSGLLRQILELGSRQLIPLEEELSFVKKFLDIEQERFHDRLSIVYDVTDQSLHCQVPSLILQPLVENSIKHGIGTLVASGEIKISAQISNETLTILIRNNYEESIKQEPSTGIGHENVRSRLEATFGSSASMNINSSHNIYSVQLTMPIHEV